ncbi:MAG: hypothetical protein IJ400_01225 [Clostridia bacterium]|nr:hypothetical protein [Clostridia bacterium]
MSLLTRISKKMQISDNTKRKAKGFFKFIKSIKYELLFGAEVIALVCSAIYLVFGRKKHFSFFVAVSTLIGTLASISAMKHINSKLKSKKYIDIISSEKKDSCDEVAYEDELDIGDIDISFDDEDED